MAESYTSNPVCGLFRKLINGYAGQGASERLNKLVKKIRNKLRNRQSHQTTVAWLKLDSYYKLRESKQVETKRYIDIIREKVQATAELLRELQFLEEEEEEEKELLETNILDEENENENEDEDEDEDEDKCDENNDFSEDILIELLKNDN